MSRKRRKAPNTGPAVSLFPFLAVLICTMGVLIVMLVLAVKSSSNHANKAKQEHQQDVTEQRDALLQQLDHQEFRVEQIAKIRPQVQQRLEDAKLSRSHLDDEIRQLDEKIELLQAQFQQLDSDQKLAESSSNNDLEQIEELTRKMAARKLELTALRQQVVGKPTLYSIVPTRTASGTGRRPIYVECTPEGMKLQPSGIKISLSDFTRPILPGNPLDAALLATREYWNKFEAGSSEGEPYPLIVVRPGGASAYAIARRAMSSWDDEFGYELVEAKKQLDWGQPDSNLSDTLNQAVQLAMARQQQMVDQRVAQWMGPRGNRRFSAAGTTATGGFASGNRTATQPTSAVSTTGNRVASNMGGRATTNQSNFNPSKSNRPPTRNSFIGNSGDFDTTPNDSLSRLAENRPQWRPGNQAQDEANPLREWQNQPKTGEAPQSKSSSNSFQPNGQTSTSENGQTTTSENGNRSATGGRDPAALANIEPLSDKRGNDWALPTRTPGATPYRRPIRVACLGDRYIVYPSDETRQPVQVTVDSSDVDQAIDQLIHQVWKQIEGWGMAEIGGYWKPVLRLAPDASGTNRAEELARKLKGSGIEIERVWR